MAAAAASPNPPDRLHNPLQLRDVVLNKYFLFGLFFFFGPFALSFSLWGWAGAPSGSLFPPSPLSLAPRPGPAPLRGPGARFVRLPRLRDVVAIRHAYPLIRNNTPPTAADDNPCGNPNPHSPSNNPPAQSPAPPRPGRASPFALLLGSVPLRCPFLRPASCAGGCPAFACHPACGACRFGGSAERVVSFAIGRMGFNCARGVAVRGFLARYLGCGDSGFRIREAEYSKTRTHNPVRFRVLKVGFSNIRISEFCKFGFPNLRSRCM